jgi:hypothetical protein
MPAALETRATAKGALDLPVANVALFDNRTTAEHRPVGLCLARRARDHRYPVGLLPPAPRRPRSPAAWSFP